MVPDQEMSLKLNTGVEISPTIVKNNNPVRLPEKMMIGANNPDNAAIDATEEKITVACASNSQDNGNIFGMEISPGGHAPVAPSGGNNKDVEVNIVDDFSPDEERVAIERDLQDVTESSSSFGCTDSGTENDAMPGDVEVESQVQEDAALLLGFDGFGDLFKPRKKKVTDHWRDFIRPLMGRCKWLELHIRELNSQASKYERELAEINERKQKEWEKYATEDLGVKSVPFIWQNRRVKVMRRKRKRVEETVDLASHTSHHNLFSYYAKRKLSAGAARMDNDHDSDVPAEMASLADDFGVNGELSTFNPEYVDPLESILRKIEEAQTQVRQLRVRMDKVVTENAEKFTFDVSSFAPCDPLHSSALYPISPNVDRDSLRSISQRTAGEKLFVPEMLACNYGEGATLSNKIKSTGRRSKCENMENDILIYNQPLKQELNNAEEVAVQHVAEQLLASKGKAIQYPNSPSKTMATREQQSAKVRPFFKLTTPRKRKRGRRKARSSRWSRRSSG